MNNYHAPGNQHSVSQCYTADTTSSVHIPIISESSSKAHIICQAKYKLQGIWMSTDARGGGISKEKMDHFPVSSETENSLWLKGDYHVITQSALAISSWGRVCWNIKIKEQEKSNIFIFGFKVYLTVYILKLWQPWILFLGLNFSMTCSHFHMCVDANVSILIL